MGTQRRFTVSVTKSSRAAKARLNVWS